MTTEITTPTTWTVPGMYATPLAAMQDAMNYTIAPGILLTIDVSSGSYNHSTFLPSHPQGRQILIKATSTVTFPVESDYVITGTSTGARATDNANHLTMLCGKFGVQITCATSAIDDRATGFTPDIQDILFIGDTGNNAVGCYIYSGLAYFTRVAFHGFDSTGLALTSGGLLRPLQISVTGCGLYGVQVSDESSFKTTQPVFTCSNLSTGFLLKRGGSGESYALVSKGNGGNGVSVEDGGVVFEAQYALLKSNGAAGGTTTNGGTLAINYATVSNNATFGLYAQGGHITAPDTLIHNNGNIGAIANILGTMNIARAEVYSNGDAGIKTEQNGVIYADHANVHDNAGLGIWARYNGRIYCGNAISDNNGSHGLFCDGPYSGITAPNIVVTNNGGSADGVQVVNGGRVDVSAATISSNGRNGILVNDGGYVHAKSATVTGNASRGLYIIDGGDINAENATINTNTSHEVRIDNSGNVRITGVTGLVAGDLNLTLNTPGGIASQAVIWA